ncbi:Signal transduction histidine kinase [Geodermatophilus saharensis]|uniref:histidine kinase n=1 Tax=Geodermatophilus saharensis TaxID=1137994 RepID=A0A239B747_9ACTN|nr:histidine kinase [Geodermatophilus saharensis]SNS02994.1 Signal transduction histidine kinase [Geodermatophilus saharensis]
MTTTAGAARHPAVAAASVPRWTSGLDLAVAAGLALWGLVEVALSPGLAPVPGALFVLAATLPLALRRRFPGTVTAVVAAALVVHAATAEPAATFTPFPSLLLAAFTVAVHVRSLPAAVGLGVLPVAAMGVAGQLGYFGVEAARPRSLVLLLFFVAGAWTGGRVVHHRALAALRAEEDSAAAAGEAVALERARIARELHDVVAHSVSVVVLQTGAAEAFVVRDPDRALAHLGMARRTAAEAMREMRHLLDVLREGHPDYAPQPGIPRLADLVRDARDAGLDAELTVDGDVDAVPDGPSLAVYRLVQESLTNVLKHAPAARVRVQVAADPQEVRLVVRDDGGHRDRGVPAAPGGDLADGGGGHGLPGMRERVRVYGGSLTAGAVEPAGWEVRAVLPLVGP